MLATGSWIQSVNLRMEFGAQSKQRWKLLLMQDGSHPNAVIVGLGHLSIWRLLEAVICQVCVCIRNCGTLIL